MRSLIRHAFMPLMLAVVITAWVEHAAIESWLAVHFIRVDAMTAILLGLIGVVWLAEQLCPANPDWNYGLAADGVRGLTRFMRDVVYLLIVTQLTALLIHLASTRLTPLIPPRHWWPATAPVAVKAILAFFLVELMSYGVHRAAHRWSLLWRFHGTHHVITELTGLKSLHVHPVDNLVFYVGRSAPLLFLGAGAEELTTAAYLGAVLGVLSHANVDAAPGVLGWIVNYPRYHSVHHSADLAESNANFGCHTVLWDRLFGTFRAEPSSALVVGVEPVGMRPLAKELAGPFFSATP